MAGLDVLSDDGIPLGKRGILTLTLSTPTLAQVISQPWTQIAPGVDLAASLDATTAEPGQRLLLTLFWRMSASATLPTQVMVTWPGVEPVNLDPHLSGQTWPAGTILRTLHSLTVPPISPDAVILNVAGVDLAHDRGPQQS